VKFHRQHIKGARYVLIQLKFLNYIEVVNYPCTLQPRVAMCYSFSSVLILSVSTCNKNFRNNIQRNKESDIDMCLKLTQKVISS
jgi:hypothetical protein